MNGRRASTPENAADRDFTTDDRKRGRVKAFLAFAFATETFLQLLLFAADAGDDLGMMPQTSSTTVKAARMGSIMFCIAYSFQRRSEAFCFLDALRSLSGHLDLPALEQIRRQRNPAMLDTLGALGPNAGHHKVPRRVSFTINAGLLEGENVMALKVFAFHAGDFRHAGHFSAATGKTRRLNHNLNRRWISDAAAARLGGMS